MQDSHRSLPISSKPTYSNEGKQELTDPVQTAGAKGISAQDDIKFGSIPKVKEVDLKSHVIEDKSSRTYDPPPLFGTDYLEPVPSHCTYHELSGPDNDLYAVVVGYNASSGPAQDRGARSLPAAIRINNSSLLSFLGEVTEATLPSTSCLMLYPFKLLVAFNYKIRASLEGRIAGAQAKSVEYVTEETSTYQCFLDLLGRTVEGVFFKDQSRAHQSSIANLQSSLADIEFDALWMIFSPGVTVVDNVGPSTELDTQAYRIWSVHLPDEETQVDSSDEPLYTFRLVCYSFNFDGEKFSPQWKAVDISRFSGSKPITGLPVYPTSITKNLDEELKQRGKKFITNCHGHGRYKGMSISKHVPSHIGVFWGVGSEAQYIDNEVFVDFEAAHHFAPHVMGLDQRLRTSMWPSRKPKPDKLRSVPTACQHCHSKIFNSGQVQYLQHSEFYQDWQPREATRFGADSVLINGQEELMPPFLLGMSLKTKRWHILSLALFSPLGRQSPIALHINSEQSAILKAVINSSSPTGEAGGKDSTENADGLETQPYDIKDRGLVVLLHGPPGSGKVNCVRSVAESAHPARLVYHIRGGEPPSEPENFASFIRNSLELANRWNGVVLFEDAEIYLTERDGDMNRSRITSLFLSILGEFQGVIFLTTSRVGLIDEALKARVHFALAFPHPNTHASKSIWRDLMNREYKQGDRDVIFKAKELMRWANRQTRLSTKKRRLWNEKRIANTIHAAIALASDEMDPRIDGDKLPPKIDLREDHLRLVVKMTDMFDSYLEECRGNDEDRASEFSIRANNFEYDEDLEPAASTRMDSYRIRRPAKKRVTSPPPRDKKSKARFTESESDSEESRPEDDSEDDSEVDSKDESDSADSVPLARKKSKKKSKRLDRY